ncbi:MAG: hypothetical protein AMXMBFR64_14750 [Myxococcales bacterium]
MLALAGLLASGACSDDSVGGSGHPSEGLDATPKTGPDLWSHDLGAGSDAAPDASADTGVQRGSDTKADVPPCVFAAPVKGYCWVDHSDWVYHDLPATVSSESDLKKIDPFCIAYAGGAHDPPVEFETEYLVVEGAGYECGLNSVVVLDIQRCYHAKMDYWRFWARRREICCGVGSTAGEIREDRYHEYIRIPKDLQLSYYTGARTTMPKGEVVTHPESGSGPDDWESVGGCWGLLQVEWGKAP